MSSLTRLNNSIRLKRVESQLSLRQCQLNLKQLLFSIDKKVKKNPFASMILVTSVSLFTSKYRKRLKIFYPFFSFGRDCYQQYIYIKKEKDE
jgi:hypothetical protein